MHPSKLVPASSGTWAVTRSSGWSAPRPTSTPATVDVIDFDTDIRRWVLDGVIPLKYRSVTTLPWCRTSRPSVYVSSSSRSKDSRRPPDLDHDAAEVTVVAREPATRDRVHAEILAVGIRSRTCWNPQRLNGGSCQFASVTSRSGGGGDPSMRPSSAAVGILAGFEDPGSFRRLGSDWVAPGSGRIRSSRTERHRRPLPKRDTTRATALTRYS